MLIYKVTVINSLQHIAVLVMNYWVKTKIMTLFGWSENMKGWKLDGMNENKDENILIWYVWMKKNERNENIKNEDIMC